MDRPKVLMIINPRAGKMNFRGSFYGVVKQFSDAGYSVIPYFTTAPGDAAKFVEENAGSFDRFIACGQGVGSAVDVNSSVAVNAVVGT